MHRALLVFTCICLQRIESNLATSEPMRNTGESNELTKPNAALIKHLAVTLQGCGLREIPRLRKVMLSNTSVTCNDGSLAGYYIRKSYGSKRWLVFLEGGWYCFDRKSCDSRWIRMRNLMSSRSWPEHRHGGGILSADPEENPFWWNANHIFVPYCSSDSWSGASPAKAKGDFAFLGTWIIQAVIKDLLRKGLAEAQTLLLAGSSAGGIGVLLNLDPVADLLRNLGFPVRVMGLADSGWFLDNEPYQPMACTDPHTCAPMEAIKLGIRLWNGQVPERCKPQYSVSEQWRCYFGYRLYSTLQAPLFVFQWLFDEAQMTADNVGAPLTKDQWDYIHKMGNELRSTLKNVTAVFAPSCISHIVLTKRDWQYVKINQVSLPQALRCWEIQQYEDMHWKITDNEALVPSNRINATAEMVADMPLYGKRKMSRLSTNMTKGTDRQRNPNRKRRQHKSKKRRKNRERKRHRKHGEKKKGHRRRDKRSLFPEESSIRRHQWSKENCRRSLIDECSWPQCNLACPRLHNPFTGEEMDFIELLKSFGLDMSSVANALGIDMTALNEMDHDTLLQLLTQQTNK